MINDKELSELKKTHTPTAIRKRLESGPKNSYLKDFIYGSIDGVITTFAIVSGVVGAELSSGIIIILGFANLLADGFSMGISNYLGTKSENELIDKAKKEELSHIEHYPEGEREEIRQIFSRKGFIGDELESAVNTITSDVNRWVETMLQDELGFSLSKKSAFKSGFATFIAFILIGFIPLASFVINWISPGIIDKPFLVSSVFTGLAFFFVGAYKTKFVGKSWYLNGLETLVIGGIAAIIAYYIGSFLKAIV